jgi:phage-related baseplate assembly protein
VFSPHYGRRSRIVITKQAYLGKDYSMPQLLYKVYWEGAQKVRLLWPVSQIVE